VRSEHLRIIGPVAPDLLPKVVLNQANIDFALQNCPQALTLGVIDNAGELDLALRLCSLFDPGGAGNSMGSRYSADLPWPSIIRMICLPGAYQDRRAASNALM
jgi:hypothetical protein